MFKKYELVFKDGNTWRTHKKYRKYDDAYDEAEKANVGRETSDDYRTAYIRRNGHFVHRRRSPRPSHG